MYSCYIIYLQIYQIKNKKNIGIFYCKKDEFAQELTEFIARLNRLKGKKNVQERN